MDVYAIFITCEDAENELGGYDSIPPNNSTRSTFCNHFCNPELSPARILKEDTSQKVPYFILPPCFFNKLSFLLKHVMHVFLIIDVYPVMSSLVRESLPKCP